MDPQALTIGGIAGLIAPFLVALLNRMHVRQVWKRAIAIGVAALLTVLGLVAIYEPQAWQAIAAAIIQAVGVMQTVYTALKPVFDAIEGKNKGGARHAEQETQRV